MKTLRALVIGRPVLAMMLVLAALFTRALVPVGYMPSTESRSFTIQLCSGIDTTARQVAIAFEGHSGQPEGGKHENENPCAFSGLAMPLLGGAHAALLAVALDHVMALGFAPVVAPVLPGFFLLRPPLRGPPVLS